MKRPRPRFLRSAPRLRPPPPDGPRERWADALGAATEELGCARLLLDEIATIGVDALSARPAYERQGARADLFRLQHELLQYVRGAEQTIENVQRDLRGDG